MGGGGDEALDAVTGAALARAALALERTDAQETRLTAWLRDLEREDALTRLVVVECGAGTAIPTVRRLDERLARAGATLVRINVRESDVPGGQVGLALGAAEASARLEALRSGQA